jgi:serine/threonine protein kinase
MPQRSPPPRTAAASRGHHPGSSPTKVSRKISPPRSQPPHTPDELQFAKRTLQKLVQDSHFFPVLDKNNRVQTIRESELEFGSVVGKGGFCEVRMATLKYSSGWGGQQHGGRGGNQQHRDAAAAPTSQRYAMKYLSPTKTTSSRVFQRGIADLAMEACFLSLLRHENIIGLHYVSEGSLEENYNCAATVADLNNNHHHHHHHNNHNRGGGGGGGGGQADEIVMDAYGNLQLRRRPQQPPPPLATYHLFGYFLLLDPLHETLTDRIDKTYVPQIFLQSSNNSASATSTSSPFNLLERIRHKNHNSPGNKIYDPNDPKFQLAQRLSILKSIASALKYLHDECHIIFRDIKPDNIGFYRRYHSHCSCGYHQQSHQHHHHHHHHQQHNQNRGERPHECTCYDEITKLFDFGLAKELKPKYRKSHSAYPDQDTFKLTGCTGSRRYMAPEVCFSDPYNQKADVYSFGMLLYQVTSLVTPFDGFSMGKHEREVLRGGFRPDVKIPTIPSSKKGKKSATMMQQEQMIMEGGGMGSGEKKNQLLALRTKRYWPRELPGLMEECWDYDMRYRPEMSKVAERIDRCIEELFHGKHSNHGGIHGNNAAAAGHWPKFNPNDSKDCAATNETTPTSSHPMSQLTVSHGAGGFDGHVPFGNSPQQPQPQQQFPAFAQTYSHPPSAVPNMSSQRKSRRNESDGYSNISAITDAAVYQQQRRRSSHTSNNNGGEEPMMMDWT